MNLIFNIKKHSNKPLIFFLLCLVFIAVNAWLILNDFYFAFLIPVALLFVFISVVNFKNLFYFVAFFTPLSLKISEFFPSVSADLSLPTEPVLIFLSAIIIVKILKENLFNKQIITHPVSVAVYFYLLWMFITCITSTNPLISFKFLISKLWFIVPVYFAGILFFNDFKSIQKFIWLYISGFLIIIIWATYNFYFHYRVDNNVMVPFYNDHTAYGAALALFIPVIASFLFLKYKNFLFKLLIFLVLIFFLYALGLSYSRAAWIGLAGSVIFFLIIHFRIKIWFLGFTTIFLVILFMLFRAEITDKLSGNKQDSSSDVTSHIKSISNISTDASNMERINRWKCVYRMFLEKPVLGWGPGTYQFKYAPFQFHADRTIISTDFGDLGNAHSEYFGPLAESGILGFVSVILLFATTLIVGIKTVYKTADRKHKIILTGLLSGLVTYYIHGTLNNFLDTDKLSVPFWAFTSLVAILSLKEKETKQIINI